MGGGGVPDARAITYMEKEDEKSGTSDMGEGKAEVCRRKCLRGGVRELFEGVASASCGAGKRRPLRWRSAAAVTVGAALAPFKTSEISIARMRRPCEVTVTNCYKLLLLLLIK